MYVRAEGGRVALAAALGIFILQKTAFTFATAVKTPNKRVILL
jgi:hypothetical protein